MSALVWDQLEERFFETGTDHGVLYMPDASGAYVNGVAWNGLTGVTESPSGAEAQKQYADNINYVTLFSAEEFAATIEAFTAPDEFFEFDGVHRTASGLQVGQQRRPQFGFSYRTKKGNALNEDLGYILHLVYGAQASPSEKAYATVNDSPEPVTFSWAVTTTPVPSGISGLKPTAIIKIDSTDPLVSSAALAQLETILYGTAGVNPRLPMPAEVDQILDTGVQIVTPVAPTYNSTTDLVTIPDVEGVVYKINGVVVTGDVPITTDTVVTANPEATYTFGGVFVSEWLIDFV
jgi:hypothetical protein